MIELSNLSNLPIKDLWIVTLLESAPTIIEADRSDEE